MTLNEILELHPKGGDAATLRAAIGRALTTRNALLAQAADLDRARAAGLLSLDTKALMKIEDDAAQARLAADRIEALLPTIEAELSATEGAETLASLRTEAERVNSTIAAVAAWHTEAFPILVAAMTKGLALETATRTACRSFQDRVAHEYRRREVREAGPLGVEVSPQPELKLTDLMTLAGAMGAAALIGKASHHAG